VALFRNSSRAPGPQSSSVVPPGDVHREAAETVARWLRVYGDGLFETDPDDAREVAEHCDALARCIRETMNLHETDDDLPVPSAKPLDWAGVSRFFQEQRHKEVTRVTSRFSHLQETVRAFARGFQQLLSDGRHSDRGLDSLLQQLSDPALLNDAAAVSDKSQELVRELRAAWARRETQVEQRVADLQARIAAMQAGKFPSHLDPATRLPSAEALRSHLEFLAGISKLMATPPVLVVLALDLRAGASDELMCAAAAETLRRFFAREHFVARAGESLLAVVLPATPVANALETARDVLHAFRAPTFSAIPSAAGMATLVAGESAALWWQRAHDCLAEGDLDGTCRIAAVPAIFE
jgi:GGDEF domain-containing protein